PPSRRRAVTTVLVTAAVIGALAGGALAFPAAFPNVGDRDGARDAAAGRSIASPARHAGGATGPAGTPGPAAATRTAADPRGIRVPTDPLAGVAHPAFTRAGDEAQPSDDEWRASTTASTQEEKDTAQAIEDDVRSMLATKGLDYLTATVTFNRRAQTVMVTGGPVSQLPEDDQEVFRRAGEMASCTTLARRLQGSPTTWSYGRYSVFWKNSDGDTEADVLGFGQATDGCYNEVAGQWQGDESGMATAQIPSTDKDEIRVAGATDKAITAAWKTRVAEGNGVDPSAADDDINLGFDPAEKAAYVWIQDTYGGLIGRAQRDNFQDVARRTTCRKLRDEYSRNQSWQYIRWSVAVYGGNMGTPEFIGSGDCLS
ncbi:serine/threonine protein kinase, partial [Streptomyces sp. NPDC127044]